MAENTYKEPLNDSLNTPPDDPSKEIIPSEESADINSNQEVENMEVHHHAHHEGKKNWRSYFWEFLMLFLAVFCGFLAEYYLEHKIEKEKGRQFIVSFYGDLKTDTSRISYYTNFDDDKIKALDDLSYCYDTILNNENDASCLVNVIKHSSMNKPFMRTDRTLKQLANAGGFRLLKKEDADSIISYDEAFNNFQDFQSTVFQEAQNNVRNTLNTFGNFKANIQMFKPQEGELISSENLNKEDITVPILFVSDKTTINKYFNELLLYYRVTYNHKRMLLNLKEKQTKLIEYFKGKYHVQEN